MTTRQSVVIHLPDASLQGLLTMPDKTCEIVLFASGSGSGRFAQRQRQITSAFNDAGMATLLIDLLTHEELGNPNRYSDGRQSDVRLLANRLTSTVDWISKFPLTAPLFLGLYGVGAVAAAAMFTAADRPGKIRGVISHSGRMDLAEDALDDVESATLLIVGGLDPALVEVNRRAQQRLCCESDLRIIDGASRSFREQGKLAEVQNLGVRWFNYYVAPGLMAAG